MTFSQNALMIFLSSIALLTSRAINGFQFNSFKTSRTNVVDSHFESLQMSSSAISNVFIPPSLLNKYKNTYYGLRHGESEANVAGVISSDYTIGSTIHGLTEVGRKQSQASANQLLSYLSNVSNNSEKSKVSNPVPLNIDKDLLFFSSNFTRARQTAQECLNSMHSILLNDKSNTSINSNSNSSPISSMIKKKTYTIRNELRERYFGQYDGLALHYYASVWPLDWESADNTDKGVESVNQTIQRFEPFISEMETSYSNKHIVIVSHADTLQIMQTYMCGADVRQFSQYRFKNGEVRNMLCLPPPQPLQK